MADTDHCKDSCGGLGGVHSIAQGRVESINKRVHSMADTVR